MTCYFHTRSAPKDEIVATEKEKHWGEKRCWTHLRQKLWQCHRSHSLGNHCALVEQPSRQDIVLNLEECGWRIDFAFQAHTLGLRCHGVQFTSLETKSHKKEVNLANAPLRTRQSKNRKRLQETEISKESGIVLNWRCDLRSVQGSHKTASNSTSQAWIINYTKGKETCAEFSNKTPVKYTSWKRDIWWLVYKPKKIVRKEIV